MGQSHADPGPKDLPTHILLDDWKDGDLDALHTVIVRLYENVHQVAQAYMRRERAAHTLGTDGLLGELYLKLANLRPEHIPPNREQMLRLLARMMRHLLVDYARKRAVQIRYFDRDSTATLPDVSLPMILPIHEAIEALQNDYPCHIAILEMKYFLGFKIDEIATLREVSSITVKRHLRFARSLIKTYLED